MVHQVAGHRTKLLDIDAERHKLEEAAKELTISVLPDWKTLNADQIKVSEISGGITNLLWLLTPCKEFKLDPVVLRVFGKQTDKIIDRDREAQVLPALNAAGFGAQVLATFDNGRIEAYLPMRPLKPEEMVTRAMAKRIARRLKQFHSVKGIQTSSTPELFDTISGWLQQAKELMFSEDSRKAKEHQEIDFAAWTAEFNSVRELVSEASPAVAFTHNDLLSGNILVPREEESGASEGADVQFIDFEYSSTTYRMFDVANHFCEYAGFECDYSRFPGQEHVQYFVEEYLQQSSTQPVDSTDVKKASAECFLFALLAHHFWGTWAILQAKFSPIDFDYMAYGKKRWGEYYARKEEFTETAKRLQS